MSPPSEQTLIDVPGLFNLRDHGGYATPDGQIRPGLLLRSNALSDLQEEGHRRFQELGLRTAIDLREANERKRAPARIEGMGIEMLNAPLFDDIPVTTAHYDLAAANRWLLTERPAQIARVFELICRPGSLPLVFYCSTGKDRTGLISALALSALGVSDDDVCADYALTETLIPASHVETGLAIGRMRGIAEEVTLAALGSPIAVMQATLRFVRRELGGARDYLAKIGVGRDAQDELRSQLIDKYPASGDAAALGRASPARQKAGPQADVD